MNFKDEQLSRSARWMQTNQQFSRLLQGWDAALKTKITGCLDYSGDAIRRRLLQVLAVRLVNPYYIASAQLYERGLSKFPEEQGPLFMAGCRIDSAGAHPSIPLALRSMGRFFLQWLMVLGSYLFALSGNSDDEPATLFFGLPAAAVRDEKLESFLAFTREGPIDPLREAKTFIIQGPSRANVPAHAKLLFSKRPLLSLIGKRTWKTRARFLRDHMQALVAYLHCIFSAPVTCLLGNDFAYHALAVALDRDHRIQAIVMTNSDFGCQNLWMTDLPGRSFHTHMIWYSTNSQLMRLRDVPASGIFPPFGFMRIDHQWCWTAGQSDWLKSLHPETHVHTVGPILWYLPGVQRDDTAGAADVFTVGIFDVIPVTSAWEKSYGLVYNYYQMDSMMAFIDDIMSAVQTIQTRTGLRMAVEIKHKRAHQQLHASAYVDHIEALESAGRLRIVPTDVELFSYVRHCDLVIVVPYSSPVYVAASQGTPAIYYDPSGMLLPSHDPDPLVTFIASPQALQDAIEKWATQKIRPRERQNECAS